MKKKMLIYFCLLSTSAMSRNHYVSNAGDDMADGSSAVSAWKTINRVNKAFATLSPGDSVLFKCGQVFYGQLILSRSGTAFNPITISSYGTGAKPVITGLSKVIQWVNSGYGIYSAPVANVKNNVNLVIKNGVVQQVGRYPNADDANGGYLVVSAGTGGAMGSICTITGPALSSSNNWTGAELVLRIKRWDIQRQRVTAHSGGTVSYVQTGAYAAKAGFGYFFQRDPRTLDQPGEWWYDTANSKLLMYFGKDDPTKNNVQISTIDTLIYALKTNYITISGLQITGADKEEICYQSCRHFIIKNCDFNYSGKSAVTGWFSSDTFIDSCSAKNSLGYGFYLRNTGTGAQNQSVTNCVTDSTAMIAGMEVSGERTGRAGITVVGNNTTIALNTVQYSGYLGIEWWGNNVYVKNNYVHHFAIVRDDGGGIYSFETIGGFPLPPRSNRNIIGNIIMYGAGNKNGAALSSTGHGGANGIYCDDNVYNVRIDSNLSAYNHGCGFFSNSGMNLTIKHNIFFENNFGYSFNRIFAGDSLIRGLVVKKNILYPYKFSYGNLFLNVPSLITLNTDISALGVLDSNYYALRARPDTSLIGTTLWNDGSHYSVTHENFDFLKDKIGIEAHSTNIPMGAELFYNPTNKSFTRSFAGLSKKGVDNTIYDNSITLKPFEATVLYPN